MTFFTIGYGGRAPAALTERLIKHGVRCVADVRLRPDRAHMGVYVMAKTSDKGIERWLNEAGIEYRSFPELGNLFLEQTDWWERYEQLLRQAGDLLTARLLEAPQPFCLLCCEKDVNVCHRLLIAKWLVERGHEAVHIVD